MPTFDEFYSAMAVQGSSSMVTAPMPKRSCATAKVNVESLNEFDYFTFVRKAGEEAFAAQGSGDY